MKVPLAKVLNDGVRSLPGPPDLQSSELGYNLEFIFVARVRHWTRSSGSLFLVLNKRSPVGYKASPHKERSKDDFSRPSYYSSTWIHMRRHILQHSWRTFDRWVSRQGAIQFFLFFKNVTCQSPHVSPTSWAFKEKTLRHRSDFQWWWYGPVVR